MHYRRCLLLITVLFCSGGYAQQKTYCNPINLDYGYTPHPRLRRMGRHRAQPTPSSSTIKETSIFLVPNQWGYCEYDLLNWKIHTQKIPAPLEQRL